MTGEKKHLRLIHPRSEPPTHDFLREAANAYIEAFRKTLDAFLACERVEGVRVESALGAFHGRPCLRIVLYEPGRDAIVNTKIFAAANAATTYLSVEMDLIPLEGGLTWSDVRVETTFAEAAEGSAFRPGPGRLRVV